MKWFEPDDRWETYGVKSKEDFMENLVVTGKFHAKVPNDIVNAFETVSYLLAHSYYHWPMQDEALSKALLVMEMAVKLKAKQLNISLDLPLNKKGRSFTKRLVDVIDEVCKVDNLQFLRPDFDRARDLRNMMMHPEKHSYMGALAQVKKNYMLFNNIINMLFLEPEAIIELINKRANVKEQLEVFKNSLFVLETSNKKILIDTILYYKYFKHSDNELLLLFVNPLLLNVYERLTNHQFDKPMLVVLKSFTIDKLSITGLDLEGNVVKIYFTDKLENVLQLKIYCNEIEKVDSHNISGYNAFRSGRALWEMERMVYENCW